MQNLTIQSGDSGKGRSFSAALLAHVEADALWFGGAASTEVTRPVWMAVAASETELRPFLANLRCGKRADTGTGRRNDRGQRFEILRSAGYHFSTQRTPAGAILTAYLRDLFVLDPGMVDPTGVGFVMLPPRSWIDQQTRALGEPAIHGAVKHVRRLGLAPAKVDLEALVPAATLFCAYLDRRVRAPLVPDVAFQLQVFCAALSAGLASFTCPTESYRDVGWGQHRGLGFSESQTARVGLAPGVACLAKHTAVEALLAEQASMFFGIKRTRKVQAA